MYCYPAEIHPREFLYSFKSPQRNRQILSKMQPLRLGHIKMSFLICFLRREDIGCSLPLQPLCIQSEIWNICIETPFLISSYFILICLRVGDIHVQSIRTKITRAPILISFWGGPREIWPFDCILVLKFASQIMYFWFPLYGRYQADWLPL